MWRKSPEGKAVGSTRTPATPEKPEEKSQASSQLSTASASNASSATQPSGSGAATATATPKPAETPAAAGRAASSVSKPSPAPTREPAREPAAPDVASTISAGLRIKGEITGSSDLTVDGETQGKIRTHGRVTVGPQGHVNDIDAREIVVFGTVQGNLKATESVRLGASSLVEGSVLTPRISIDDGARLRGNVEMVRPGEAPATEKDETTKTPAARVASASTTEE
jgi:cytoskeletal protein CcmA (bactofilin family)